MMATPPTFRAIETRYAGHRFRSRLEARWAVFFDHLGVRWQYEQQGYAFERFHYLPDFYLPEERVHAEVKGGDTALTAALPKLEAFVRQPGVRALVVLGEVPRTSDEPPFDAPPLHSLLRPTGHNVAAFGGDGWIVPVAYTGLPVETGARYLRGVRIHDKADLAYRAARAARFEHGESGA